MNYVEICSILLLLVPNKANSSKKSVPEFQFYDHKGRPCDYNKDMTKEAAFLMNLYTYMDINGIK